MVRLEPQGFAVFPVDGYAVATAQQRAPTTKK